MGINRVYIPVIFLLIITINDATGNCTLVLNTDFGQPSPVYIRDGAYLAPNTYAGDIVFRRSDTVLVGCPGTKNHVLLGNERTNSDSIDVQCLAGKVFRSGRWRGRFQDIKCAAAPSFKADGTSSKCAGHHQLYRVGYQVYNHFHTLYEACFDRGLLSTLYVHHHLTPYSHFIQNSTHRPQFLEGDVFGKVRMSKVYTVENQRARLKTILGDKMDQVYITKTQFLARGHLAARADFVLRAAQKASFHYINASPQWMRGNVGDWAALEEALRRRISKYGSPVKVVTGTHGVCTLPDRRGRQQGLYLYADQNNNGVVPVPLYFYKLVYDELKKTAVAFVSINSSYYNSTTLDQLTFCTDICRGDGNYSWLSWRSRDGTRSFCCSYEQFARVVNYLPKLNVKGIFH